jgi:hypothetical protein
MVTHQVYIVTYTHSGERGGRYIQSVHTCEKEARRVAFDQQAKDSYSEYVVETWTTGPDGEDMGDWHPPSKPAAPSKSRELAKLEEEHASRNAAFEASSRSYEKIEASMATGDYSFLD